MTATDHHTTVSSLQVPQASQPNSGTMVMLGVGSNNNQAQAYPVATIIIQSPSQQQQQQQYISQSYPQIPPTVIYPGTTSGPPVVPSMDGRFYSSQMYPPPQPTVIVRSKSHTRSRSRSPRRGRHHSPRGRSRSPRALREHTPPPVIIQPIAPDKYTHGPSRTPSPEERPYDDWVGPRVSPVRPRSYPSPRTREVEEVNSAVLQGQMAKEIGDLREMFKKLAEEKEKERLQQARFSFSKNGEYHGLHWNDAILSSFRLRRCHVVFDLWIDASLWALACFKGKVISFNNSRILIITTVTGDLMRCPRSMQR